jgi:hypothetical protein
MSPLRIVLTLVATLSGHTAPADRQVGLMIHEADAIWRAYGVRVAARGVAGTPPMALPDGDVNLTLRFAAPSPLKRERLGVIRLVDGVPESSIEIVAGDVTALMAAAPWAGRRLTEWPPAIGNEVTGRALGRVLAHEVGHFLLASPTHTARGLMRASFVARELGAADRRPFAIDRQYLARLSARVAKLAPRPANAARERP